MKFTAFKEFRFGKTIEEVTAYLTVDLMKFLREMQLGLTRLRFSENFEAFEVEVTIPVGVDFPIRNQLASQATPTQRIITRGQTGSELIVDGDTPWDQNYVYLKNLGASPVTVKVLFLR